MVDTTHKFLWTAALTALLLTPATAGPAAAQAAEATDVLVPETPDDPYLPVPADERLTSPAREWRRGGRVSVQANVDALGDNIVGDAANEPSIAVDPTDPDRMVIGWRQFDTIASNFRQAGWAHTTDGGAIWTFPGVIQPGIFRSDPVLGVDSDGNFIYYSLEVPGGGMFSCDTFESIDGGASWGDEVFAFSGDKAWLAIDRTDGVGAGHLYANSSTPNEFNRSVDGAMSWEAPVSIPTTPSFGVTAVGPDGEVYVAGAAGADFSVARSNDARDVGSTPSFDQAVFVDLGGTLSSFTGPNPGGLLGQVWVAVDHSDGPRRGDVYLLSSVNPPGDDPLDVHFARSTDGGATWSAPVRVNDDAGTAAWQWFGTLSVAPSGRIDAVWNDTRNDPEDGFLSELFYAFSDDGGVTWSVNEPVSPAFDPFLGYPNQAKLGDYYDMVSHDDAAHVAYAATFNGEQDVYYLRIDAGVPGIFADGFESGDTSAWSAAVP